MLSTWLHEGTGEQLMLYAHACSVMLTMMILLTQVVWQH